MAFGILLQFVGMAGEFLNPFFIGYAIDAVTRNNIDEVTQLIIVWMIINASASTLTGISQYIFLVTTGRIGRDIR